MGRTFFICIGLLIRLLVDRSSSPVTPDCGQPCSTKTRSKENTNAPKVAKPLNQPSFPPRSGFVQQTGCRVHSQFLQIPLDGRLIEGTCDDRSEERRVGKECRSR